MVLASDGTASLVDLGNVDLDRAVVLGLDDAVGGAALARDVTAEKNVILAFPVSLSLCVSILESTLFDIVGRIISHSIAISVLAIFRRGNLAYRSTISPRSFSILAVFEGG